MGADKAELGAPGKPGVTLLENAIEILDGVADNVRLATGATPRYEKLGRACVLDREAGLGPLSGLAAALEWTDATYLCVLACDMPGVSAELFAKLLRHAEESSLDACLLETAGGVEPLCAVYRATCRTAVEQALSRGDRRMTAFHSVDLRVGTLLAEQIAGSDEVAKNLNTRADYARVQEQAGPSTRPGESS